MVARPMKKQRSVTDLAPSFPAAPKPGDWAARSLAERLEYAFGCSLDRAVDYLSWPPERCNPHMLAAQKEAVRCMLMIGARFGLAAAREQARLEALERLTTQLLDDPNDRNGGG
jgi:hypothetical protein